MQRRLSHAERLAVAGRIMAQVAHEIGTPLHSVAGHLELLRKELPTELLTEEAARRLGIVETQLGPRHRDHHPAPRSDPPVGRRRRTRRRRTARARGDRSRPARHGRRPPHLPDEFDEGASPGARARRSAPAGDPQPPDECDGCHAARGRVEVVTRAVPERGEVIVEVPDSGHGIPPAQRKHIFEPFFSTKEPGGEAGSGCSSPPRSCAITRARSRWRASRAAAARFAWSCRPWSHA